MMLFVMLLSVVVGVTRGQSLPCGSSDEGSLPRPGCTYVSTTSPGSSGWLQVEDYFFCEDVLETESCTRDVYIPAAGDSIPACGDVAGCTVISQESVCQDEQGWSIYYVACSPDTVCYKPCCCSRNIGIGNGVPPTPCSDAVISQFAADGLCFDYLVNGPGQHVQLLTGGATATCSSQLSGGPCDGVLDGTKFPTVGYEWVSNGEGDGAWVRINLQSTSSVHFIKVWSPCINDAQFARIYFEFSDSFVYSDDRACNGGALKWDCLNQKRFDIFTLDPPRDVDWVKLTGVQDCQSGGDNGFIEIEIFGY